MRTITRSRSARVAIFIIVVLGSGTLYAQKPLPASAMVTAAPGAEPEPSSVRLNVGRSAILEVPNPIARVSLTSADIADALVTTPNQLLINGKAPGTISMFVWDRGGVVRRYEVTVQRDLARLNEQLHNLFPGETVDVQSNGKSIVLSGAVSRKDIIDRMVDVSAGYVDKREEVVTLLKLQPNSASNQVLLRVRFAEVTRNALTELGASFFTGVNGYKDWVGRTTTEQFPAPVFDSQNGGLVFSDFLNLFLFNTKHQLGTVIKMLQTKGLFQSLAEPNLVAESGKEASFLAGGEVPVPVAQGSGQTLAISVQYKEFGVRLNFTPVIDGDRVHLKVRPEVSALDFGNAVTLNGFRIPALTTRRTETEVELENGQTFAISGLLSNTVSDTMRKMPGIGDIPILGLLFQSKAAQKDRTELVVMITPEILPRNSRGVTSDLPRDKEPFLPAYKDKESVPPPPPAFPPRPGEAAAMQPLKGTTTSRDGAAATVSALTPGGPKYDKSPTTEQAPIASGPLTASPSSQQDQQPPIAKPKSQAEMRAEAAAQAARNKEAARQVEMAAKQAEIDKRKAAEDKEKQDRLAREQAKRDAEAAKKAAEEAKKQAEIDKKHQKSVDEAAAKLKAAEAAYQAELAKKKQNQ